MLRQPAGQRADERCSDTSALSQCDARLHTLDAELTRSLQSVAPGLVQPGSEGLASTPDLRGMPQSQPDCDAARGLRERICRLAEAICELAGRNPNARDIAADCDSARSTCAGASERLRRVCGD